MVCFPGAIEVAGDYIHQISKLQTYFRLQLEVRGVAVPATGRRNLLEFVGQDGSSLLAIYITPGAYLGVYYNNSEVTSNALALEPQYPTDWTTVEVAVSDQGFLVATSFSGSVVLSSVPIVDTTRQLYKLYVSNALDTSAFGHIQNFMITGTYALVCSAQLQLLCTYLIVLSINLFYSLIIIFCILIIFAQEPRQIRLLRRRPSPLHNPASLHSQRSWTAACTVCC